jgi:RNA polymerase-binding transcription factor DksA
MAVVTGSAPAQAARSIQGASGHARWPVWRALLEAQWRARLQEVTELSLAYHEAAAAPPGLPGKRKLRQLLRRAVAARRALADTDEALGRLASGRYGLCEGCAGAIPAWLLTVRPDVRFCPRCQPPSLRAAKVLSGLAPPRTMDRVTI